MRGLRWSLLVIVATGVVVLTGCQMPFKCIPRSEFERYRQLKRLNDDQAAIITALTTDKERLTNQVSHLKSQMGTKDTLLAERERLLQEIENRIARGGPELPAGADVFKNWEGVGWRYVSDMLFDPGKATLKPAGQTALKQAAEIVANEPNMIAISGYTDSDPIRHSGWESNFELSGARALAVLEFLKEQGIAPDRLHFRGYGENALIYGPDGKEDKAKSRRAEILLLTGEGIPASVSESRPAPKVVPK